jgi:hypothetical protein
MWQLRQNLVVLEFCSCALKPMPRQSNGRPNRTTKAMIFPPAAAVRLGRNTNKAIKAMLSAMRRNSRSTFSISLPSGSSYACLPRDTLPSFKLGQVHLMLWTCILALYRQLYDSYTVISDSRPGSDTILPSREIGEPGIVHDLLPDESAAKTIFSTSLPTRSAEFCLTKC